ncbi:uncharacterized protein J8A68_003669 [[Candida] subhashii]|uniref:Phosphomutase n=1 Tax=[Candida] subhashii TaxID=561895 RepID=A0A8J5QV00_9ASCO|nr:uncharacterized protein J8A68_003669 [[Candida] subhashii]KAG7662815.1 hypothetical protein J8A68_003669 [[Candida] subhashii]
MSLLIPDIRDHHDAHGDLEEDEKYHTLLSTLKQQNPQDFLWEFESIPGFFKQTSLDTKDMEFRYTQESFGILQDWQQIIQSLNHLNNTSEDHIQYKLFFLARHGQGWHNLVTKRYSKQEWFSKWRFLGTDGELTWGPDADLTEVGINQAKENHLAWCKELNNGAPYPTKFYVSPLQRSIKTHNITWPNTEPIIFENVRETLGLHLCHKRSTKTEIATKFPNVRFMDGFPEEDELFEKEFAEKRECLHEQFVRMNRVLQHIFDNDEDHDAISITSHAGTIRAFITVLGHRKFTIPTGGMIPIVVKGTKRNIRQAAL